MSEGFSNPVADAAGNLVRAVMKSINYVMGISGWQISRNGDAEFNDVTVRGELLVTDPDGSQVKIFDDNPGNGASIEMTPATLVGHTITAASLYTDNAPGQPSLSISSPQLDASDTALLVLESGDTSLGEGSEISLHASKSIYLGNGLSVPKPELRFEVTKLDIDGPINLNAEVWNALAFAAGWANAGGAEVTGQYRKIASPPNSLQLVGELTPGTKVDNTTIATLPVGYRPAKTTTIPVAVNPTAAGSTSPLLQISAAGTIKCFGLTAGTGTVYVNALIPLDA